MTSPDDFLNQLVKATEAIKQQKFSINIPQPKESQFRPLATAITDLVIFLEKRFEESQRLSKIIQKINSGTTLDDVLNYAYNAFRPFIPYDRIGCAILEENGKLLRSRWARTEATVMKITWGYSGNMEGSSLQKIIETGQPRILNDLESYLKEHPNSASTRLIVQEGMRSSLTCPLIALDKPIGFIFFSSMKPNTYQNVHVDFFMEIAAHFSVIAEKSRLYEELLHLNELKNEFLGIAVHDIRNPLALIMQSCQLLLEGIPCPAPEEHKPFLNIINNAVKFMAVLVDNYLDVAAIESGKLELRLETVDLKTILEQNIQLSGAFGKKKNITIGLKVSGQAFTLLLDRRRIEQVLNNLISNAIKYSNPGSEISVELMEDKHRVVVSVRDRGQGIAEEELGKLFLPFSKTSAKPTGGEKSTGLGLLIVKKMVETHGGKIWVESKLGEGSAFFFSLPRN